MRAELEAVSAGGKNLLAYVDEWIATSLRLGAIEAERGALSGPTGPSVGSREVEARNLWIRIVNVLVANAALVGVEGDADTQLFGALRIAERNADRRGRSVGGAEPPFELGTSDEARLLAYARCVCHGVLVRFLVSLSRWLGMRAPRTLRGRDDVRARVEGSVQGGTWVEAPFTGRRGYAALIQLGVEGRRTTGRSGSGDTIEFLSVLDEEVRLDRLLIRIDDGVIEVRGPLRLTVPGSDSPGDPIDSADQLASAERWIAHRSASRDMSEVRRLLDARELRYRELLLGSDDPVEIEGDFEPLRQTANYRTATGGEEGADWRVRLDAEPQLVDLTLVRAGVVRAR